MFICANLGVSQKVILRTGIRAAKTLKAASTSIMRVVSQEVTSFPEEEFDVHEN
jgi:hypothetical protein